MSEHYRKNQTVYFDEIENKYLPSYPLTWSVPGEIQNKYIPIYEVMITHYFESDLLNLQEIGFYILNNVYAKREKGVIITPFARKTHFTERTIISMIDKLQDLELAERVCRTDHRGYPIDLVMRPPKAPTWLDKENGIEKLRNQLGKTAFLRKELGKDFPVKRFSENFIIKALGRKANLARTFHKFCIMQNHHTLKRNQYLTVNSKEYKNAFLPEIYKWCEENEVEYRNETIVEAALLIAENYGRKATNLDRELEKVAVAKLEKNQ